MENSHLTGKKEQEFLTIKEASEFTGKSIAVIYKHIKRGKLTVENRSIDQYNTSQTVKTIAKSDLTKFFKLESIDQSNNQYNTGRIPVENLENQMKSVLEKFFEEKEAALMKPIEKQSLYRLGRTEQENEFLKQQIETLLQELENYKALPGPVEEIIEKIQQMEQDLSEKQETVIKLQKEKEETEKEYSQLKDKVNTLPAPIEEIPVKLSQLQEEKEKTTAALNDEKTTRSKIETEVSQLKDKINILPAPPEVVVKTLKEKEDAIVKAEAKSQELELQAEEQSSLFKQEKRGLKDKIDTIKKEKEKHLKINIVTAIVIVLLLIVSAIIIPKLSNLNSTISKTTDQLHMIQATKSAIEATKEQKEKLLNKTNEAWRLYSSKKYDEAIKIYDDILQTDPNNVIAWDNKGQALYEMKRYNEAVTCFDKVLEINPQSLKSLYMKGQVLYHLKKYKEAVTCFDNYTKTDPGQTDVWNYKGKALDKMGQYSEAIKCYNKTLSIDPNNAEATLLLNSIR